LQEKAKTEGCQFLHLTLHGQISLISTPNDVNVFFESCLVELGTKPNWII